MGKRSNKQQSIISFSSSSSYSIDISSTQKGGARQHEWDRKNRLQNLNEFLNVWVVDDGYAATLHKCMSKKSKALMFLALKYEGGENWNTGQNCGRSSTPYIKIFWLEKQCSQLPCWLHGQHHDELLARSNVFLFHKYLGYLFFPQSHDGQQQQPNSATQQTIKTTRGPLLLLKIIRS